MSPEGLNRNFSSANSFSYSQYFFFFARFDRNAQVNGVWRENRSWLHLPAARRRMVDREKSTRGTPAPPNARHAHWRQYQARYCPRKPGVRATSGNDRVRHSTLVFKGRSRYRPVGTRQDERKRWTTHTAPARGYYHARRLRALRAPQQRR